MVFLFTGYPMGQSLAVELQEASKLSDSDSIDNLATKLDGLDTPQAATPDIDFDDSRLDSLKGTLSHVEWIVKS